MTEIFSDRHGFRPKPDQAPDDHLPMWVRLECSNIFQEFFVNRPTVYHSYIYVYPILRPYIWKTLGAAPVNPIGGPWHHYIPKTIERCDWWAFFDIAELLFGTAASRWSVADADNLGKKLDATFSVEGMVWKVEGCSVSRRFAEQASEALEKAQSVLANPKYQGPSGQFTKAISLLSQRPNADTENAVKDAVGAIEAVANIATGTTGILLSTLLNKEPFVSTVHGALREMLGKLYAYRGAADGVAHGQVGPSSVSIADAEFVLTTSAAAIRYVVSKIDPDAAQ